MIRDVINKIQAENINFIDPTDEAGKEWKKRINHLGDISLFPTTRSTYMGGSLPGKAREQVNYAGGLGQYKIEIRAAFPGWKGFRVVKSDEGASTAKKSTAQTKSAQAKTSGTPVAPGQDGVPAKETQAQPATVSVH